MQDCCPIYYELADPGVESLLAAVGLDVVDDGPVQGGGAAHPPRAHQHHMHTHLVISYSSLNANTSWGILKGIPKSDNFY